MIRRTCCSRMLTITTIAIKAGSSGYGFFLFSFLFICLLSYWGERHIQI